MAAGHYDLKIDQGEDYDLSLTFTENSLPKDYSGHTFEAKYRPYFGSDAVQAFTIDTTDAATGVIVCSLTAAVTAALTRNGVWDLEVTDGGGVKSKLLRGIVTVTPEATR